MCVVGFGKIVLVFEFGYWFFAEEEEEDVEEEEENPEMFI